MSNYISDVLIPRPETEELVDWIIKEYKDQNYKEKTLLKKESKIQMYDTLKRRASIGSASKDISISTPLDENPFWGHKLSLISIGGNKDIYSLRFRYGFHDFFDTDLGFGHSSYIKFMDTEFRNKQNDDLLQIDIIDILSLQSYSSLFKNLSWRGKFSYFNHDKKEGTDFTGGVGLSHNLTKFQIYSLITTSALLLEESSNVYLGINTGIKLRIRPSLRYTLESQHYSEKLHGKFKGKLTYEKNRVQYGIESLIDDLDKSHKLFVCYYW